MNNALITDLAIPEPQHFPGLNMLRFGKNPYGQPLYRVVFAPSVKRLFGGTWADGSTCYKVRPAYRQMGNGWILERWLSAQEFCQMTPEQYTIRFRNPVTGLFTQGPYPERGVYCLCNQSCLKSPGDGGLDEMIAGIERRRLSDPYENAIASAMRDAKEESDNDAVMLDKIRELRPAFGNRPTSFRGGVHSIKSHPMVKSANELGLPLGHNKRIVIGEN